MTRCEFCGVVPTLSHQCDPEALKARIRTLTSASAIALENDSLRGELHAARVVIEHAQAELRRRDDVVLSRFDSEATR